MKTIDVNLLLYAYDESSPFHGAAKPWLTAQLNAMEPTGLAFTSVLAFVRIATSRILRVPFTIDAACDRVSEWLRLPSVSLLTPTDRHWPLFVEIATVTQARGNLAPDADLAVTALEHGATLCTHDRDYSRFPGLRVEYPLG